MLFIQPAPPSSRTHLLEAFKLFLLSPEIYRRKWLELIGENGVLWSGLSNAVIAGEDSFFEELQSLIIDDSLLKAITCYYQLIGCEFVNCQRLARNLCALIATARLAAAIRPEADADRLLVLGRAASARLSTGDDRIANTSFELTSQEIVSETAFPAAEKLFHTLAREESYSLVAHSWTLYWMDCHDEIESNSSGEIPIVSTPETGPARFARLSLVLLNGYEHRGKIVREFVEHPRTALIPFDNQLLSGLHRAWSGAGSHPVRWQLLGLYGPQQGDSLSGAAAVALRHLFNGQQYNLGCLVLARIGDDGNTLEPVEAEDRKVNGAVRETSIRQVIISNQIRREPGEGERGGEHLAPALSPKASINIYHAATADDAVQLTLIVSGSPQSRVAYLNQYRPLEELGAVGSDYYYLTTFKNPDDIDDELKALLRIRPYQGESLPDVWRLIWDLDLRTLYRISSSPATEPCLLQLHDAGIDHNNRALVTVFRSSAEGYQTLSAAIRSRQTIPWLKTSALTDTNRRVHLWKAITRVGQGIAALHNQNVIHGNISSHSIYLRLEDQSLETWRLGGFELSSYLLAQRPVRVKEDEKGLSRDRERLDNWGIPYECTGEKPEPYTFEHDWYGLGMLAAILFHNLSHSANDPPNILNRNALWQVNGSTTPLQEDERELIRSLIAERRENRLKDWGLILRRLESLVSRLSSQDSSGQNRPELFVVVGLEDSKLRHALRRNGYALPDEHDWNQRDGKHKGQLREAIKQAISGATIYAERGGKYAAVKGGIILRIMPYRKDRFDTSITWNLAFIGGVESGINAPPSAATFSIDNEKISVLFNAEAKYHVGGRSWLSILPAHSKREELPSPLAEFHSFLTLMNECELLTRAAEIFPCRIERLSESSASYEILRIFPEPDDRILPQWCRPQGGMVKTLFDKQLDLGSEPADPLTVYLTPSDAFTVAPMYRSSWIVKPIKNESQGYIEIACEHHNGRSLALQNRAFLRLTDHWGQLELVRRRKKAIESLRQHVFLLKAMVTPSKVLMEADLKELPLPLNINTDRIDHWKIAALKDILAARPIYALQGPPGTGKTTLVAQLLRQIHEDDPVAQVLVTSQAHPAVNVLLERICEKDFFGEKRPIFIRLGLGEGLGQTSPGSIEGEISRILEEAQTKLNQHPQESALEQEWYAIINQLNQTTPSQDRHLLRMKQDLRRLLKRSANITFCTTSDKELEDLADHKLSYDWCIVEEAGRAHGFEFALPMQAGHRWMLLGDQAQLEPYKHPFFNDCVTYINDTINALESLTAGGAGLVDRVNINRIVRRLEENSEAIQIDASLYLKTFERIHKVLETAQGKYNVTEGDQPVGANAGRLIRNYRMHPLIGTLISETFYKGKYSEIKNATEDTNGSPKAEVLHMFSTPAAFAGRPIVWVDIPWRATRAGEDIPGGDEEKNYDSEIEADTIVSLLRELLKNLDPAVIKVGSNSERTEGSQTTAVPSEVVSLAILSPYARQRDLIAKRIKEAELSLNSGWLQFRRGLRGRRRNRPPSVHTVDSFQGNEAKIVIVSLVRNNAKASDDRLGALGFIKEKERLNVMLSRAEQLLVLVGSWQFFTKHLSEVDHNHPLAGEMRQLFEHLEELFDAGKAAFVNHVDFMPTQREGSLKGGA